MNGDPNVAWLALITGMLLQLTVMILPVRRWDWARYLGCAALPVLVFVTEHEKHAEIDASFGLVFCGMFTLTFALVFQERLLPRLSEVTVLTWTTVLLCVVVEVAPWQFSTYLILCAGVAACALVIVRQKLPSALKVGVYAAFLLGVVAMGALQFRGSDLALIAAGHSEQLDYRYALIDGAAGAYIGVHAVFLFEILPIPGKHESWTDFKTRWTSYIHEIVSRLDDVRLDPRFAVLLVLGIVLAVYANHELGAMPDRVFANFVLFGLPTISAIVLSDGVSAPPTATDGHSGSGIGRARHSRKHRQS